MSRKIIITQKQLDEIVGGDSSYLDNISNSDFKQDAANSVYAGDKYEDKDTEATPSDKVSNMMRRDTGGYYGVSRGTNYNLPIYMESKKSDWRQRNLSEDNQNLVNRTYGDDKNRVTNNNASTLKSRYAAAKKKSQSADPTTRQQGLSTMRTMEKNNPNIRDIESQYNNAMANDANIKKLAHDRGEQNVYQKAGYTKNTMSLDNNGNKQVIVYQESKMNESKSIKSKKLFDLVKQHGGFHKEYNWMHKDFRMTNADLHNVTDDDVIGVVTYSNIDNTIRDIKQNKKFGYIPGDDIDHIELQDGSYLLVFVRNAHLNQGRLNEPNTFKDTWDKKQEREKNNPYSGKHNNYYRWKSKDAEDLAFKNPFYKDWNNSSKEQLRNKIKNDYKKQ